MRLADAADRVATGVGGLTPIGTQTVSQIDGFVARFNPNGLAAYPYGGLVNNGQGVVNAAGVVTNTVTTPCTAGGAVVCDRSNLIHTPQFNFGEFLYAANPGATTGTGGALPSSKALTTDGSLGNTVGNAIAVDITRSVIIGGTSNNSQTNAPGIGTSNYKCPLLAGYNANAACLFTTTNFIATTGLTAGAASGGQNNGSFDGWVATLLFNDILTDAPAQASANPFLEPNSPNNTNPGAGGANTTYIETTPPPFGPTFDFALSDPSTQTQTFEVFFTANSVPWYVPLDSRSGNTSPMTLNGHPGSAIVYYIPCYGPAGIWGNNAYPAPGGPYGPQVCATPPGAVNAIPNQPTAYNSTFGIGVGEGQAFSGWPSANPNNGGVLPPTATGTHGQGWLLVNQDVGPGVVRLQLDRRAAAGLLEGTYVAQFLVTTYDPRTNLNWPPCGSLSSLQPFQVAVQTCINPPALNNLPADNSSILITVRLVAHPSIFLSRNAGLLTGITSALSGSIAGGLTGPTPPAPTTASTRKTAPRKFPSGYSLTRQDQAHPVLRALRCGI